MSSVFKVGDIVRFKHTGQIGMIKDMTHQNASVDFGTEFAVMDKGMLSEFELIPTVEQWISVRDEKPYRDKKKAKKGDIILFFVPNAHEDEQIQLGYYDSYDKCFVLIDESCAYELDGVSHWMPRPKPPKPIEKA